MVSKSEAYDESRDPLTRSSGNHLSIFIGSDVSTSLNMTIKITLLIKSPSYSRLDENNIQL